MQYTTGALRKGSRLLGGLLQLVVWCGIVWLLWGQLQGRGAQWWQQAQAQPVRWHLLVLAAALLPINQVLEALRWQVQIAVLEAQSFGRALRGVLSGYALGVLGLQAAGELGGRILHTRKRGRAAALGAWSLGNLGQTVATHLGGGLALACWGWQQGQPALVLLAALLAGLPLLLWGYQVQVAGWLAGQHWLRRLRPSLVAIGQYSPQQRQSMLGFSLLRYAVFALQMGLAMQAFCPLELGTALALGATSLLAKALLPIGSLFGDLLVRNGAMVLAFQLAGTPYLVGAGLATTAIWLLNLLVPSLLGSFTVLTAHRA